MKLDYPFIKSVSLNDLPEEAWQYFTGGSDAASSTLQKYYQAIPWMFRGVDILANAAANVPFAIYRGETEVDTSDDYQNATASLPNLKALIGLVEAALTIWGYAYCKKDKNAFGFQAGLRYWLPTSITYKINSKTGIPTFTRTVDGTPTAYTADDIMYFWKRDPFVEIGPPSTSPAKSAAAAAGVLFNADKFAAAFFERGAIKVTLLTTKNIQPSERSRLKTWWGKLAKGTDSAWSSDIVNADAVTPVVIGEGLESLENNTLTESKRIDIAAGLGVPYTILFSGSASGIGGGGVSEEDTKRLYDISVLPNCEFIAEVINAQYLEALGYRLVFKPQEMDIYQEDENDRAASLSQIIAALQSPEEFVIASAILGYDIADDIMAQIQALITQKQENREIMAALPVARYEEEEEQPPEPPDNQRAIDLDKWRTKALKRVKAGRDAACPFDSKHIAPVTKAAIMGALEGATTEEQVKAIFSDPFAGYP